MLVFFRVTNIVPTFSAESIPTIKFAEFSKILLRKYLTKNFIYTLHIIKINQKKYKNIATISTQRASMHNSLFTIDYIDAGGRS
jgi:hypothetical protein